MARWCGRRQSAEQSVNTRVAASSVASWQKPGVPTVEGIGRPAAIGHEDERQMNGRLGARSVRNQYGRGTLLDPAARNPSKETKMTHLMTTLKTGSRAAVVALVLGASVFSAAPAFAQSQPSFNFQFGIGGDGRPSFGVGVDSGRPIRPQVCYSDRQIVRALRDEGYRDVEIVRELPRNRVGVVAREGRAYYSMRVNRCTGEVDRIERIRSYRPGLSLQFNF